MFAEIKFMNGLDPTNIKERELATAEKKSHSARIAHKRRREKQEALSQLHTAMVLPKSPNTPYTSGEILYTPHCEVSQASPASQSTSIKSLSSGSLSDAEEGKDLTSMKDERRVTSDVETSSAVSITRQPHSSVYLAFKGEGKLQKFQFYINYTGPAIAEFHSRRAGESYTRVIPQMAVSSSAVRHMLLAFAHLHTHLLQNIGTNTKLPNTQSLYHYSKSLESMRKESSQLELLAAAVLGYTFEVAQNNTYSAVMHIKGYRAIMRNYSGSRNEQFEELMTADHKFIKEVSPTSDRTAFAEYSHEILSFDGGPRRTSVYHDQPAALPDESSPYSQQQQHLFTSWDSTYPDSTAHARHSLESIIGGVGESFPLTSMAKDKLKEDLSRWVADLIACDLRYEHFAKKTGILWLFILVAAVLPVTDTEPFDRLAASHLHEYIVRDISSLGQVSEEDVVYMTDMLEHSVKHTTKLLQQHEYRTRLKTLLDDVEASGPHHLYSRAWVAVKHIYYHVTCEEISKTSYGIEGLSPPTGQGMHVV